MSVTNTTPRCQNCKYFMDRLLKEQIEQLKKDKEKTLKELEYLRERNSILTVALDLAVDEIEDAKEMLRDEKRNDLASMLNASSYYFESKAKIDLEKKKNKKEKKI